MNPAKGFFFLKNSVITSYNSYISKMVSSLQVYEGSIEGAIIEGLRKLTVPQQKPILESRW